MGIVDIDLKAASKFFASRFSCGSSVTGEDEIVIQGDFKDDLFDILTEKWSEVRIKTSKSLLTVEFYVFSYELLFMNAYCTCRLMKTLLKT